MLTVDASVALKLVLNETDSDLARALWESWLKAHEIIIVPVLFRWETLSTVRRKVHQQVLTEAAGEQAYEVLENMPVRFQEPDGLYSVAWQLAKRFNRPTVYDCCYLALASMMSCELWTADRRLANAVGDSLPWVRTPWT